MLFGMTRGEMGLVVFIFALVYGAGHLQRLAERLEDALGRKDR